MQDSNKKAKQQFFKMLDLSLKKLRAIAKISNRKSMSKDKLRSILDKSRQPKKKLKLLEI